MTDDKASHKGISGALAIFIGLVLLFTGVIKLTETHKGMNAKQARRKLNDLVLKEKSSAYKYAKEEIDKAVKRLREGVEIEWTSFEEGYEYHNTSDVMIQLEKEGFEVVQIDSNKLYVCW